MDSEKFYERRGFTELFNERVAIMIYEGQLCESEAIHKAYFCVRSIVGIDVEIPDDVKKQVKEALNAIKKTV